MEDTLKLILSKLNSLENGQAEMRAEISDLRSDITSIISEQASMRNDISGIISEQASIRSDISNIVFEQAEMRKEIAFYYGSMMINLDETKTKLSSEMKQFSFIQKQQQRFLEFLNEK